MNRVSRSLTGITALLVTLLASAAAVAQTRPNIVLVIGDDHGWPYSGFMGHPVARTPNLDALAAEGVVFSHAFTTASVCAPSLRTLLAGIHSTRWDRKREALRSMLGTIPSREEVVHYRTLPRELARFGYRSFEGGKHWEGSFSQAGFTHGLATAPPPNLLNIVGDDFGRTGIEPLREFLDQTGGEPFFVWFAPALPHTPFNAPQEYRTPYEQLGRPSWEVDYFANVSWLDAVVGELLAELDQRGLRESTLVVYLSDNGWELRYDTGYGLGLRHGKGTLHELGNRTPLVMRWPGTLPAGVVRGDLVSSEDLVPTLLEFAGAEANPELRGLSLVEAVFGSAPVGRDRVVTSMGQVTTAGTSTGYVVRTPEWRYMAFPDGHEELYAIDVDPYETDDVAAAYPDLLPAFRADVQAFTTDLDTAPELLEVIGRLTDAQTGAPVAGTRVRLVDDLNRLESLTDAGGWFAFRALPPGNWAVDRVRGAFDVRWAGVSPIGFALPIASLGAYLPLTGVPTRSLPGPYDAEIRGVVRDDFGQPVRAAVRMRGRTPGGSVRLIALSDADGRYRIEHLPLGSYRLKAWRRGYAASVATVEVIEPGVVALDLLATPR